MPALPVSQWFSTIETKDLAVQTWSDSLGLGKCCDGQLKRWSENNLQLHCTGIHCILTKPKCSQSQWQRQSPYQSQSQSQSQRQGPGRLGAGDRARARAGLMWSNNVLCKFQGSALLGSTNRIDGAGDGDGDADSNWIELKLIESNQIDSRIDRLETNRI